MSRFRISKRLKPSAGDFIVMGAVIIAAVLLGIYLLLGRRSSSKHILIWQDGELKYDFVMSELTEKKIITIQGKYTAEIAISQDYAAVVKSNCPHEDCVEQGAVSKAGESVICLPNRLVVEITDGNQNSEYDAVSG